MKQAIDFQEGHNLCIEHIDQLIQDGDLLAEKGSFGHATFLYFTAMEEGVKAWCYAGVHVKLLKYETIRPYLMKHLDKTGFFAMARLGQVILERRYVPARTPTRDEFIEGMTELADSIPEFRSIREDCLYVDLYNNEWESPLDVGEEDFRAVKDQVIEFVRWVKDATEALFEIPEEKQEEVRPMVRKILASVGMVYVENLYRNKILTEEEYEGIKSEIELQSANRKD